MRWFESSEGLHVRAEVARIDKKERIMIDASTTIAQLTIAIDQASAVFAQTDGATATTRPEVDDARATLARLTAARDAYIEQWVIVPSRLSARRTVVTKQPNGNVDSVTYPEIPAAATYSEDPLGDWQKLYQPAFVLLDRHASYVIERWTVADAVTYAYAPDQATHDLLAAKALSASQVQGTLGSRPGIALEELARYNGAFVAAWTKNPLFTIPSEADASPTGVALTAAISAVGPVVDYLTWAKDNPT